MRAENAISVGWIGHASNEKLKDKRDGRHIATSSPKLLEEFTNVVATGSPQDESVRCADLWPVHLGTALTPRRRPTGPWLQRPRYYLTYCREFLIPPPKPVKKKGRLAPALRCFETCGALYGNIVTGPNGLNVSEPV